jgi:alkaline phosphatase D
VLPPLSRLTNMNSYCAYDGEGNTFENAISDVGEGDFSKGTSYESWSEIPTSRTRLLKLCQQSINNGYAKKIVFVSGDQHWAEIQAKKMPSDADAGDEQMLYEVTASGIDQRFDEAIDNSSRVRVRSADHQGTGEFDNECNFPFKFGGVVYDDCTSDGSEAPWCSIETETNGNHIDGRWGNCIPEDQELVPRSMQSYGTSCKCTNQYHHTCTAQANYGGISVDWSMGRMKLAVYTSTPHHEDEVEASSIFVDF